MARGKRKTTIIHVKSAPTNYNDTINLVKLANVKNDNTSSQERMLKLMKLSPDILNNESKGSDASSIFARNESANDYVQAMQQICTSHDDIQKKDGDELIESHLKTSEVVGNAAKVLEPELMVVDQKVGEDKDERIKKIKKKKKNKRKVLLIENFCHIIPLLLSQMYSSPYFYSTFLIL